MAFSTGTAIIDFGAYPGSNEASIAVTGQTGILSNTKVEAFVMADDNTTDHTANDHRYLPQFVSFTCSNPTAGVGFTIYGRSIHKMTGTYQIRFVWSD